MELYQLRQFVAVVETGSFTKGAARVAVSQPALSATIAKLEDEFQVQLLERRRGAVTPTDAGKRLYAGAETVLRNCSDLRLQVCAQLDTRRLRVGVLRTLPTEPLARLLRTFRQSHPDVLIELRDGDAKELKDRLRAKRIDLAITIVDPRIPASLGLVLFEERYVAMVHAHHRLASRSNASLSELHGEPFIVRTNCETFQQTTQLLRDLGVKAKIVYKTDQDDRALTLVRAGVGIALLPESFNDGTVFPLALHELENFRTIGIRWRKCSQTTDQTAFTAFATSHRWHAQH